MGPLGCSPLSPPLNPALRRARTRFAGRASFPPTLRKFRRPTAVDGSSTPAPRYCVPLDHVAVLHVVLVQIVYLEIPAVPDYQAMNSRLWQDDAVARFEEIPHEPPQRTAAVVLPYVVAVERQV